MVADRYKLAHELARGGMGTVWLARDTKLGRQVAIKVMAQELAQSSEATSRFQREAMAVAQLRSSHVVEVYDYGIQEGLPYIVMELLEGEHLGQRLKRLGRIPFGEVGGLLDQMCKGLKAAHEAGLVHRDLKPSNIFIAARDDAEMVKLLDFGVVKALDPILLQQAGAEHTSTGILLGTPQYMSPEQARAVREIDHRSDLWSIAVIVFRMLTGDNPFRGESVGDVVLKICSDELPSIRHYNRELPQELDAFFAKAFERKPSERYQSAAELARAFQGIMAAALQGRAVEAEANRGIGSGEASLTPLAARQPFASSPEALGGLPRASAPSSPGIRLPQSSYPAFDGAPSSMTMPIVAATVTAEMAASGAMPGALPPEPTPVSTTVGGTQLASMKPSPVRVLANQPLTVVVGTAAALIVSGLVAAVWIGSAPGGEASPREVQRFVAGVQPPSSVLEDLGEERVDASPGVEAEVGRGKDAGDDKRPAGGGAASKDSKSPPPGGKDAASAGKSGSKQPAERPKWF